MINYGHDETRRKTKRKPKTRSGRVSHQPCPCAPLVCGGGRDGAFPATRGMMIRICSWCKKIMGTIEPINDPTPTHGICPECSRKLEEEEKLNENQPHSPSP